MKAADDNKGGGDYYEQFTLDYGSEDRSAKLVQSSSIKNICPSTTYPHHLTSHTSISPTDDAERGTLGHYGDF